MNNEVISPEVNDNEKETNNIEHPFKNENQSNEDNQNIFSFLSLSMVMNAAIYITAVITIFTKTNSIFWTILWSLVLKLTTEIFGLIFSGQLSKVISSSLSANIKKFNDDFNMDNKNIIDYNLAAILFQSIVTSIIYYCF